MNPTDAQYTPPNLTPPGTDTPTDFLGALPFTGMDLLVLTAIAVLLVAAAFFIKPRT